MLTEAQMTELVEMAVQNHLRFYPDKDRDRLKAYFQKRYERQLQDMPKGFLDKKYAHLKELMKGDETVVGK